MQMYLQGNFFSEGRGWPGRRVKSLQMEKYRIQHGSIVSIRWEYRKWKIEDRHTSRAEPLTEGVLEVVSLQAKSNISCRYKSEHCTSVFCGEGTHWEQPVNTPWSRTALGSLVRLDQRRPDEVMFSAGKWTMLYNSRVSIVRLYSVHYSTVSQPLVP